MIIKESEQCPNPTHLGIERAHRPNAYVQPSAEHETILLEQGFNAREKSLRRNVSDEVIQTILSVKPRLSRLQPALIELLSSKSTAKSIAKKHGVSEPTLSYWTQRLKLPRRRRGRPVLLGPTPLHERMLALVRIHGVAEAARRSGLSRQRVHQVVCTWAPELKGHSRKCRMENHPNTGKPAPKDVVVSFRLTRDEWQRLTNTDVQAPTPLNAGNKARLIVLQKILGEEASSETVSL